MAEGLTGNINQLPLPDLLRMLGAGRQSGRLDLADRGQRGVVYLREGAIVHAGFANLTGERAALELLGWTSGAFRFDPRAPSPDASITASIDELIASAERLANERAAVRKAIPTTDRVVRLSSAAPSAPVTLAPLEWLAVTLVEGSRTVDDVVKLLPADELEALRAISSLVANGLLTLDQPAFVAVPRHVVSMEFFRLLRSAAASALGPLAPMIIEDEVTALGATLDSFPRERVSVLVERVAAEIQDEDRRMQFQQRLLPVMRQMAA